jgi:hypothetical protein
MGYNRAGPLTGAALAAALKVLLFVFSFFLPSHKSIAFDRILIISWCQSIFAQISSLEQMFVIFWLRFAVSKYALSIHASGQNLCSLLSVCVCAHLRLEESLA